MSARLQRLFKKCRARRNESDKENNFARAFRFENSQRDFFHQKALISEEHVSMCKFVHLAPISAE